MYVFVVVVDFFFFLPSSFFWDVTFPENETFKLLRYCIGSSFVYVYTCVYVCICVYVCVFEYNIYMCVYVYIYMCVYLEPTYTSYDK
jgi:hypothetical protein